MDKTYILTEEEMKTVLMQYQHTAQLINAAINCRIPSWEEIELHNISAAKIANLLLKNNLYIKTENDEYPESKDQQWKSQW